MKNDLWKSIQSEFTHLCSRYGQKEPCYVHRLIIDNTLERKIYDRQIKQVTADGVASLVGDEEEETPPKDFEI